MAGVTTLPVGAFFDAPFPNRAQARNGVVRYCNLYPVAVVTLVALTSTFLRLALSGIYEATNWTSSSCKIKYHNLACESVFSPSVNDFAETYRDCAEPSETSSLLQEFHGPNSLISGRRRIRSLFSGSQIGAAWYNPVL